MKNSRCWPALNWHEAQAAVAQLNAGEGDCDSNPSAFTDWQLPTKQDWLSLIDAGENNPALTPEHPFMGVQGAFYWSESHAQNAEHAWYADLHYGYLRRYQKDYAYGRLWPVRKTP
jgi:hypothetical protein